MKKQDIEDIQNFIEEEISGYDINYDFDGEGEVLYLSFNGHFTGNKEVEFTFRCNNGNVEFYSVCESYVFAETREFWINFMSKIYE